MSGEQNLGAKMNRREITFEQAEGLAPLPSQLKPGELSPVLRARLWNAMHRTFDVTSYGDIENPWVHILRDNFIKREAGLIHQFENSYNLISDQYGRLFAEGSYGAVLGFIEFVLRHPNCPATFRIAIRQLLEEERAAYRIVGDDAIMRLGSEEELASLEKAFTVTNASHLSGSHTHLKLAASLLTAGRFADSVRESAHALESVVRLLEPDADLSKALAKLEKSAAIHGALKSAVLKLYGFASDNEGIRHALVFKDKPDVDESDALFMLGASAAFVTYLIGKARAAGLVK